MALSPRPATPHDSKAAKGWLRSQKQRAGHLLSASVALGSLAGILLIAQAAILAYVSDQAMFAQQSLAPLNPWLAAMVALLLGRVLLKRASNRLAFEGAAKIKASLRHQLTEHLFQLGPQPDQRSAALSTLLNDGVEALEDYYARYLPAVAFSAMIPLAILAVVLPLDGLSGLIFLFTAPLIPFFMILVGQQAENLNQQRWQQLARLGNHFLDLIQGLTQLRLLNASRREANTVAQIADDYRKATMSVLKVAFLSSLALEFLATISIALAAVTIGFRLYYGELDFGTGFLILLLAPEFYLPLRNMGTQYHARMAGVSAAESMLDLLAQQPAEQGNQQPTNSSHQPPCISLDQVHYQYGERQALNGLSLQFTQHGLHAIVGRSGAGKSTLLDLLLGFIQPVTGQLLINGTDLQQLDLKHWRAQLSWVPQSPRLFFGSVADNLRLASPEATDSELEQAARQAGADEFIQQLPQGYQTPLGEAGAQLSGGQRQRLALARALLKNAPVLILDEPSAHLDPHSEALIQAALADYARDHLVIVVAQRLHTIRQAKQIYLLDEGKLIEQGSHHSLLARKGHYARLLDSEH